MGRDDLFSRPESLEAASRNGVVYSNGNRVIRHLGIPTVTVPMGFMSDIQMPVGLTFAGAAYSDDALLDYASAYEQATRRRQAAFLTPTLPSNQIDAGSGAVSDAVAGAIPDVSVEARGRSWQVEVRFGENAGAEGGARVWADGHILRPAPDQPGLYRGAVSLSRPRLTDELMILTQTGRSAASLAFVPLPEH